MILKQDFAAAPVSQPSLDWYDLHEVVSEGDSEDRNGRYVQHWVELANLAEEWDVLEVLIV